MTAEDIVLDIVSDMKQKKPDVRVPKIHFKMLVDICGEVMKRMPDKKDEDIKMIVLSIFKDIADAIRDFKKFIEGNDEDNKDSCDLCPEAMICPKNLIDKCSEN